MRWRPAALVCALTLAASPALAAEDTAPPAQVVAPPAPGIRGLPKILGSLFGGQKSQDIEAPTFDTTQAPVADATPPRPPLTPPAAPPVVVAKSRMMVRLVVMPMPRLRPMRTEIASTAGVSFETTGSIPFDPPDQPPATAASAEPPPVAATVTSPPPVALQPAPPTPPPANVAEQNNGDPLLGDVTGYHAPDSTTMVPTTLAPDVVDPHKPPTATTEAPPLPPDLAIPLNAAPFELVRTLQSVQDRIAQGVPAAVEAQRALLAEIDRQFAIAPASAWQDRRNAEAAVTYVLSGGVPTILTRLSTMDPRPAIDIKLVNGVLAYANGNEPDAWAALSGFNPLELPATMGAQVALAQAALAVRSDPQKAMRLLSLARLLAPGTLVEEAAIRRQLFVANQLKADDMVESLARQYLDRFRHSVYAGNFRLRFAAALSRMDIDNEASFARIDDMLSTVEASTRCQLYLTIASASIVNGRYTAGRLAAERAATFSSAGSPEEAQAHLYDAAALAADPKGFDTATTALTAVNRNLLHPSDGALYAMVADTLEGIRTGTLRDTMPKAEDLPPADADPTASALAQRANDAVKSVDDLLKVAAQ